MRCRNCHTVMMDTDLQCPTCHSSVASATAGAPGPIGNKPNGLLMLLPIFGGAAGGLLYGLLTSSGESPTARGAGGPNSLRSIAWAGGFVLALLGGLFLGFAGIQAFETWKVAERQPREVPAAELRKAAVARPGAKSPNPSAAGVKPADALVAGAWIAYSFAESRPTEITVTRRRGQGGDVTARCLLVRVEDRWLVASVPLGFDGNRLVGRLRPLDAFTLELVSDKTGKAKPRPAALLPYEFHGVEGSASDQQARYTFSAWLGGIGLAGLLIGIALVYVARRQTTSRPAPASSSFLPLPSGR